MTYETLRDARWELDQVVYSPGRADSRRFVFSSLGDVSACCKSCNRKPTRLNRANFLRALHALHLRNVFPIRPQLTHRSTAELAR